MQAKEKFLTALDAKQYDRAVKLYKASLRVEPIDLNLDNIRKLIMRPELSNISRDIFVNFTHIQRDMTLQFINEHLSSTTLQEIQEGLYRYWDDTARTNALEDFFQTLRNGNAAYAKLIYETRRPVINPYQIFVDDAEELTRPSLREVAKDIFLKFTEFERAKAFNSIFYKSRYSKSVQALFCILWPETAVAFYREKIESNGYYQYLLKLKNTYDASVKEQVLMILDEIRGVLALEPVELRAKQMCNLLYSMQERVINLICQTSDYYPIIESAATYGTPLKKQFAQQHLDALRSTPAILDEILNIEPSMRKAAYELMTMSEPKVIVPPIHKKTRPETLLPNDALTVIRKSALIMPRMKPTLGWAVPHRSSSLPIKAMVSSQQTYSVVDRGFTTLESDGISDRDL